MTNERKKFIYFPSLATGAMGAGINKNLKSTNNIPCRFFSKEMPEEYYHPYFLLTAGHQYKKINVREEWGLHKKDGIFVLGDSGGYQIASGALTWSTELREKIFLWLENNSDIAMNIDIPTNYKMGYRKQFNSFNECLDVSFDNFKYFEKHQTGKTKYLNILHGQTKDQIDMWYNKVKDFNFSGWAFSDKSVSKIMYKIAYLIDKKEFENTNIQYLHILGISKLTDFFMLNIIQNELNNLFDNRIQLTIDSSSPGRLAAFGGYSLFNNYFTGSIKNISFSNKIKYNESSFLPCNCPVCKNVTFKNIKDFNTDSYLLITLHNFFKMLDAIKIIEKLINSNEPILKESINNNLYMILNSIKEIMNSELPIKTYNKFLPLFNKKNNMTNLSFDTIF